MAELLSPRLATGIPGVLGSVIDEAHRRARLRRVLSGGALFAALSSALILFFALGGGGGSGTPSPRQEALGHHGSGSPATSHGSAKPVFFFGGIRRPPGGAQLKRKHQLLAQPTAVGTAAIWTAPDWAVTGSCVWLTVGRSVYGGECRRSLPARRGLSEIVPLSLPIKGQILNLIWGHVGRDVESLRLRFQDGTETDLPVTDSVFFYVLPKERGLVGHRPTRLTARVKRNLEVSKRLEFRFVHLRPGR